MDNFKICGTDESIAISELLKLYHSHKANCCKCGCTLSSDHDLGAFLCWITKETFTVLSVIVSSTILTNGFLNQNFTNQNRNWARRLNFLK